MVIVAKEVRDHKIATLTPAKVLEIGVESYILDCPAKRLFSGPHLGFFFTEGARSHWYTARRRTPAPKSKHEAASEDVISREELEAVAGSTAASEVVVALALLPRRTRSRSALGLECRVPSFEDPLGRPFRVGEGPTRGVRWAYEGPSVLVPADIPAIFFSIFCGTRVAESLEGGRRDVGEAPAGQWAARNRQRALAVGSHSSTARSDANAGQVELSSQQLRGNSTPGTMLPPSHPWAPPSNSPDEQKKKESKMSILMSCCGSTG
jgi:hypothetical protein